MSDYRILAASAESSLLYFVLKYAMTSLTKKDVVWMEAYVALKPFVHTFQHRRRQALMHPYTIRDAFELSTEDKLDGPSPL